MNSSPRDSARPVSLDTPLEPRLAIELLSTVQTQPQESADAKHSLGLEENTIRKAAGKSGILFAVLTISDVLSILRLTPNCSPETPCVGPCVLRSWEVSRRALTSFLVISKVLSGYISLGQWRRSNFGICQI